jgi:hypothetical protein
MIVAWLCVILTLRSLRHSRARDLLSGTRGTSLEPARQTRWLNIIAAAAAVLGLAHVGAAFAHSIPDSEGFFFAGMLLLIAAMFFEWARLREQRGTVDTVIRLGIRNAGHRPGRSVLSIALIASAVFLVVALDAFRRPPVAWSDPHSGAGGFPYMAETQVPLFWDPNTPEGRENLNISNVSGLRFYAFRLHPGEDASCLNLYEPRSPRVLGVRRDFTDLGRFSFTDSKKSWKLLDQSQSDAAIPAIADANSITYVLHRKIGDTIDVNGKKLRLVAALDDSIFQGHWKRAFPITALM